MGPSPKTSTERPFCFWNDSGRRPGDSHSSAAGSCFRAAVVFEICPLSRNAALRRSGQTSAQRKAACPHRGIQSARAPISRLSSGAALGRTKSCPFPALTPKPSELAIELASLGRRRWRARFRRRGSRCYVLLDEIPEGCREQEGYQLRPPVLQEQSLHNVRAIKSRRSAGETFPACNCAQFDGVGKWKSHPSLPKPRSRPRPILP